MSEQRRMKRLELNSSLIAKELKEDNGKEYPISVIDISKKGLGFECEEALQIAHVYEGHLRIWTQDVIHAFFEIVRIEKKDDTFLYGAVFVGMPELDSSKIAIYEMFEDSKKES